MPINDVALLNVATKQQQTLNCAYCFGPVVEDHGPQCWHCKAYHHLDCWKENGGCSQFGCEARPPENTGNPER